MYSWGWGTITTTQFQNILTALERNPIPIPPFSPPPRPLATINLPAFSMGLLILDISREWWSSVSGFFSSTLGFRASSRSGLCQSFTPFCGYVILACVDGPHFIDPRIRGWTLGLFPLSLVKLVLPHMLNPQAACRLLYSIWGFRKVRASISDGGSYQKWVRLRGDSQSPSAWVEV